MSLAMHDDLLSPAAVADPHACFRRWREDDPIRWSERHRAWVVTGYDQVDAGLRHPDLSADRIGPYFEHLAPERRAELEPTRRNLAGWMVFTDPPDHTRLRRLVARAFTPRMVEARRPRIERLVDELLTGLEGEDTVDLVRGFAYPLPAIVIAELLGVPPEDRDTFKGWSDEITALVFGALDDPDRHRRAQRGIVELGDYLRGLVHRFRAEPADNLMSVLVAREEGDELSTEELVSTCTLLLFGGHETTTNLVANGVLALLRHPEQLERLRADPALVPSAVEELLRYDGPTRLSVRWVRRDHDVEGRRFARGQRVFLANLAANRDPARFPDPDALDVGRSPNPHLAFGFGLHYCLGASLARLEAQVAIRAVVERFPRLALAADRLEWQPTLVSRGLVALPVRPGGRR